MSNKNLDTALREVLSEIRQGLAEKVKALFQTELNKVQKSKKLNRLVEKKERLQKERSDLERKYFNDREFLDAKICEAQSAIDIVDGVSEESPEGDADVILDVNKIGYRPTKSQIETAKNIEKSPEAKNYFKFLDVEKNTNTMYSLAITAKEKRNIIFSIQSRDWRSLGIEVPQLPYFEKFDIKDGEIKVPKTPQIEAKSKA